MALILVIDDDERLRETARRILESRGHSVVEAEDGMDGLKAIAEQTPDLVITDIFMPGQDGIETIIALRKRFPGLKIIAISGGSSGGVLNILEDAEMLGATRSIPKPFTPRELIAAVSDVLGTAQPPS